MLASLLRLATTLAGQSAQRAGRRVARVSLLLALALLFVMIGLTGFAVAGFILLARVMDPVLAALLLGSLCCLIAAILLLIARAQTRPQALPARTAEEELARRDLTALLQTATQTGIWLPLILALLGGFFLTSRKD